MANKKKITIDELAFIAWKNEQAAKFEAWNKASDAGTLKDDDNPAFLFNLTPTSILLMIIRGEISATWLASKQLASRGLDKNGQWVGFDKAEEIHDVKPTK